MKKIHLFFFALFASTLIFSYLSCTKIVRTAMLKGKWEVKSLYINGGSNDMIGAFFPNHNAGNGKMIINFSNSGVLKADHYSYGEIDSTMYGTWKQLDETTQQVKMGTLLDGIFTVELQSLNSAIMHTNSNLIRFYNIGYVTSVLDVSKVTD